MLRRFCILMTLLLVVLIANLSCSSSTSPSRSRSKVSLTFTGLDSVSMERYELWAVSQGVYTSLGRFNLNAIKQPINDTGGVITQFSSSTNLAEVSRLAVTLEPEPDADPKPSAIEMFTADITQSDTLTLKFQVDYTGRAGNMIIITPSDGGGRVFPPANDPTNEFSGIWFVSKPWGEPELGLTLVAPPAGWKYEGWYMDGMMNFISTGKFSDVTKKDADNGYLSNVDSAYVDSFWHYPGEDFLTNAPAGETFPLDVRGGMALVTLEPEPDNSAMPFMPFILYCKNIDSTMVSNHAYPLDTPPMPVVQATLK